MANPEFYAPNMILSGDKLISYRANLPVHSKPQDLPSPRPEQNQNLQAFSELAQFCEKSGLYQKLTAMSFPYPQPDEYPHNPAGFEEVYQLDFDTISD